ncbi:MAG: hypothetical protein R8M45_07420 [Ghiorsea sp.]
MSASAHGLLSRIAQQKRDKEAEVLVQLNEYRGKLAHIIQQSEQDACALQVQHESKLEHGAQAVELMMMDQSIAEHRQRVFEVRFEMGELDKAIAQQRQKWAVHHKKHVAHDKMHDIATTTAKRIADNKQQVLLDNQFAATSVANKKVR